MTRFHPLPLRVVDPAWADRVVSPARDSFDSTGRRERLNGSPDSFVHIGGSRDGNPAELSENLAALHRLVDLGAFGELHPSCMLIYRLSQGTHVQTGVVGGVATQEFADGTVRVHERIHTERAKDLVQYYEQVGVQSSPIVLAHPDIESLSDLLATTAASRPPSASVEEFSADRSELIRQEIWTVDDETTLSAIATALDDATLYLIDGHHRAAAAVAHRASAGSTSSGSPSSELTLCVAFPSDQLLNLAHHRLVPGGVGAAALVEQVGLIADVRELEAQHLHGLHHDDLVAYADGYWQAIRWPADPNDRTALADLDPVRLDRLLSAVASSAPDRPAPRLAYRPGLRPAPELTADIDRNGGTLFLMRPVQIDQLLTIADDGLTMPPKSTYFVPKLRSGLMLRRLT